MTDNLFRRLENLLWSQWLSATFLTRPVQRVLQYVYALLRDFLSGHLSLRATGLVYITILALVPVIAISFSVLKAFGGHRELEPLLHAWLAPLGPGSVTISTGIINFVDNVQGNLLAGVGLVLLFITTVSMAQRVEDSINFIWRVDRPRNLVRRFSDYLSVVLLGPVVVVTALGLIASLESYTLFRQLAAIPPIGTLLDIAGRAAPYLVVCLAFSFVYWFVPNTKVKVRAALAGGLVGGILWAGAGILFTRFVVNSAQTLTIYATFAIVIIALVWIYVCWLTLLVGAQLAFYVQNPGYLRVGYRTLSPGGRYQEFAALSVMLLVADAFKNGGPRPTAETVAIALTQPAAGLKPVLARLELAGLLTRSERDELLPNRDPDQIPLYAVLAAVRDPLPADILAEARWPLAVQDLMTRTAAAVGRELDGETLGQLAARLREGG